MNQESLTSLSQNVSNLKADLKNAIINCYPEITFPYNGYLNNNGTVVDNTSFKTTDFINVYQSIVLNGTLAGLSSLIYYIHCYDENYGHLGKLIQGTGGQIKVDNLNIELLEGTKYVRISTSAAFINVISLVIPASTLTDISEMDSKTTEILNKINDIGYISGNFDDISFDWVIGYISPSGIKNSSSDSFNRTDLVEIPSNAIGFKVSDYTLNSAISAICFYDANTEPPQNNFVSSFSTNVNLGDYYALVPPGAKYYGCSKAASNTTFSLSFIMASDINGEFYNDVKTANEYNELYGWLGFSAFSKFASVGDSLSVGYHTTSSDIQIAKDLPHSWGAYVEKRTGAKSYWTGVAGATCKSWLESNSQSATWGLGYCRTIGTMPLYVICMGANEYNIAIGTSSDIGAENPTTLYGYVSKVIAELRAISPNSYIVCTGVSRRQNSTAINAVYKYICEHTNKCYYLDCEKEFNSALLKPYYYNFHYSASGYVVIAKLFDYKLSEAMQNNVSDFLYIDETESN